MYIKKFRKQSLVWHMAGVIQHLGLAVNITPSDHTGPLPKEAKAQLRKAQAHIRALLSVRK
jgi:hypothetical protein